MIPEFHVEWRSQTVTTGSVSTDKDEKERVSFPTTSKKVDNPSIGPDGKHVPKKKTNPGQQKLPL